ncbi:hypothetical protein CUR178_05497 [Leishmania enriettii]|uniref:BAR domain-containing protein n=1 Tax=Leishmania enriettii TaxID=5663 RepID=A0A836HJ68_LEIEN|nr:hypothetical protein CUR178_05497 [Leishmania enriettii]
MLTEKSPSPTNSSYDFALRHERVKLLEKVLKQLDGSISRTVLAMREVASCLSLVGQSYHEVAQCVSGANPNETVDQAYSISAHDLLGENYEVSLQNAATLFSAEMKNVRSGDEYFLYNGAVHQTVLMRLHKVLEDTQKARGLGDDVKAALKKAMNSRKIVHQKEAKYMRKGLALTESKLYAKQAKKMRQHDEAAEVKRRAFDAEYGSLMKRQLCVAGHTMGDFLDANTVYMSKMLKVLGCLAPNGEEAIRKMADSGERLDESLGVALRDQLSSQLRTRGVRLLGASDATLVRRGACAGSGKEAFAMSSCGRSLHNFIDYCEDPCLREPSAERAPPTARALERDYDESNERCRPFRGTPQRQLISSQTLVSAAPGTAGVSKGTSCAFSSGEPYASPPLRAPSFPAALRRVDTMACSSGKMISCHAPFGDGSTPPAALPAACVSLAAPPAQYSEDRLTWPSRARSAVLAAQAGMCEADGARFSEPFADNPVTSTRERTPHMSLQPMVLFPLDANEGCSPRQATPRTSTATSAAADAVTQQHPRRDTRKVTEASAAARGGVSRPFTASAPPGEDTEGSSVITQCQEESDNSLQGCYPTHGHGPPPQQQRLLPRHAQRSAAPENLAQFQAMALEGGVGASSYQWCSDGLDSEPGGVSGRSHNVSTGYGLDSPVPTPQWCARDTRAWEDAQVRP